MFFLRTQKEEEESKTQDKKQNIIFRELRGGCVLKIELKNIYIYIQIFSSVCCFHDNLVCIGMQFGIMRHWCDVTQHNTSICQSGWKLAAQLEYDETGEKEMKGNCAALCLRYYQMVVCRLKRSRVTAERNAGMLFWWCRWRATISPRVLENSVSMSCMLPLEP